MRLDWRPLSANNVEEEAPPSPPLGLSVVSATGIDLDEDVVDTGDDVLERFGVVSAEIVVAELMLVVVGVELLQVSKI